MGNELRFVCREMPGPGEGCVFVECEDANGNSVNAGEWRQRADGLAELVVKLPAEQHQGEPVAWEMDDTAGESGKILVTNDARVRDEWVRNELPVAPLFGRADPGEVERLRGELDKALEFAERMRTERETLRAQLTSTNDARETLAAQLRASHAKLAERDAQQPKLIDLLTRLLDNPHTFRRHICNNEEICELINALSASAEPEVKP